MAQLTEENLKKILEDRINNLPSKLDLQEAVRPLATKQDIKSEVRKGVEELARIVSGGFDDVQKRLDVLERVQKLESDMHKIKEALHISV